MCSRVLQSTLTKWVAFPSGVKGPRLTQLGCLSPAGGEGLWPGWVCGRECVPVCNEEEGVRQHSIHFYRGGTEALNGQV